MRIVFVSNYHTHHQVPFSEAMNTLTNGRYCFIETEEMETERVAMGWEIEEKNSFVLHWKNTNSVELQHIIDSADAVITGSAPDDLVKSRLKSGKIVFRYSERWYKKGFQWSKWLYRVIKHHIKYGRYKNAYMLCASAYTAADCAKTGLYLNKTYKWGYFPEAKHHNIDSLIEHKKPHSIIWVARFIDWKHPEACIKLAKKLLADGITDFNISMIGNGVMLEQIKEQIVSEHLENNISVLGSMTPDEVRRHMEDSEIFIFTSDRNEGWGAVLNESMNSGCAVVASSEIGSVPYLINDGENGFIYQDGSIDDLYKKVKDLYFDSDKRKRFGVAAYHTIADLWNADVAAERLLLLINDLETTGTSNRFQTGPCSRAEIIKDGWYKS